VTTKTKKKWWTSERRRRKKIGGEVAVPGLEAVKVVRIQTNPSLNRIIILFVSDFPQKTGKLHPLLLTPLKRRKVNRLMRQPTWKEISPNEKSTFSSSIARRPALPVITQAPMSFATSSAATA
jgi:hypothetical protein